MSDIRILLAEDHEIIRKGIVGLIEKIPDMRIVGEAGNGQEAVTKALELVPDVIIMDVMMPGMNGIEATGQILRREAGIKVITLSVHADREYVLGMLKAGAMGYLLKDCAFEELIQAVRMANERRLFISRSISETLARESLYFISNTTNREAKLFTHLEKEILQHLARGKVPAEIAAMHVADLLDVEGNLQNIVGKWLMLF